MSKVVGRRFYRRDAAEVAPELLNKVLVMGGRSGRIVEVEAYRGSDDPGSHAFGGPTRRNAVMFGPPGLLYVYFSYGMHWCANAVCDRAGVPHAVLIRALVPLTGLDEMRQARSGRVAAGSGAIARAGGATAARSRRPMSDRDLCRGPGRLCQALGVTGELDGADLVTGDRGVRIFDDGVAPPDTPGVSARIGLSKGAELPWRFYVAGDRHLSRRE
ncbi:MAG: DNA-3-methyladenine glycosylase [Actinomycetota bacterium]|nr:DNA-3-methyladenine glycosylase [Actinomycetota bacterium]